MKNKSNFRNVGIGFLIASILYFIFSSLPKIAFLFLMWISGVSEAFNLLFSYIFEQPGYTQLVLFLTPITELIIFAWSLVIAIILIKNKEYTPQIKYSFYFVFIQYLFFFILFLSLSNYTDAIINLIAGLFVYFIAIWKKGFLSRFVYSN